MSKKWEHFRWERCSSPTVGDIKKVPMTKTVGEKISHKKVSDSFPLPATLPDLSHFLSRIIDKIRSIPKPKSFADAITQACPSEAGAELPPSRRHNRRPASMKMLFMSKSSVQSRASFMDPIVLQYYRRSEEGRESINRATAIRPATVQRRRSHFCCCK